jgi:DNA-binding transcriptional LysR family regulator
MDRLSNIAAFVTVAETGNFAEAARRLNIANSVVSKRIKDLEAYLGVRLLERSTRRVRLTDTGYQYFDQTRRIITELAETEENIRYHNENPVGELKVSAPVSFGVKFMGPAVSSYLDTYPDVVVKLSLTDRMVDMQSEGFDIAIGIGDIPDPGAITKKLAESRGVVVASPAYIARHGRPERPQDLSAHNCMAYSHLNDGRHWPFRIGGKKHLQSIDGRFGANNGMLLADAAVNGCGIVYLPTFLVANHIASGALEILLEEFEEPPITIRAAWLQQRLLSARTRTFIDHMAAYFGA